MRRPLVSTIAILVIVLVGIAAPLSWNAVSGQQADSTPSAETAASPVATPAASPIADVAACDDDAPLGRLVGVPNRVTIELTDSGFDPAIVQSTDNTTFDLTLENTGTQPHSFVLEDFDLRVELAPGESESFVLTPKDRGGADDHYFHGDLPGEECFRGKLVLYI